jgi:cell division septation protein DedD
LRIEASVGDRRVHRLAVGGFGNRADAAQLCRTLRSKGRDCFVRNITGETPVQLARTAEPDRA